MCHSVLVYGNMIYCAALDAWIWRSLFDTLRLTSSLVIPQIWCVFHQLHILTFPNPNHPCKAHGRRCPCGCGRWCFDQLQWKLGRAMGWELPMCWTKRRVGYDVCDSKKVVDLIMLFLLWIMKEGFENSVLHHHANKSLKKVLFWWFFWALARINSEFCAGFHPGLSTFC